MKYFTKEVQIALVAIVGLVVLFFGLQFLKGVNLTSTDTRYYAQFDDMSGLSANSPVYADGYKVGIVKDIIFNYGGSQPNLAVLDIDAKMRLPKGTAAEIETDMLGNVELNLLLANNPRERMQPGDTIMGNMSQGLLGRVETVLPALEKMLPKLDSILTSVNTLLADPAIANSLHNMERISSDLTVTTRELNTMMGSVNRQLPGLLTKADGVMDNTQRLTANLSAIDVQATMAKVNATLDNVEKMTQALNSKEGTIGLLMRDPSLYLNLSNTMRSADSLLIDLKAHPKRYVHFSLFGKKDK
ncbi:MAG: MlaD family protein [Prevotella sp.]|nr:MlaD family protein [Prevotella sp.]